MSGIIEEVEGYVVEFARSFILSFFTQVILILIYIIFTTVANSLPSSQLLITPSEAGIMIASASYIINLAQLIEKVSYVNELYESYLSYSRDIMESGVAELLIVTLAWMVSCFIIILHVLA